MPHLEPIVMDRERSSPDSDRREGRRRSMGRDSHASDRRRGDDRPDFGMAAKEAERQRNSERPEPGQILTDNKPIDFRTLAVSNWNENVTDDEVEEGLFQSCKKYGDFNIKVMNSGAFRVAYVNFRFAEDAADAKHHLTDLIMFDRALRADPVYNTKRGRSRSPDGYRNKFPRGGGGGGGGGGGRNFHRSTSPGSHMGRGGGGRMHPAMNRDRNFSSDTGGGGGHFENRRNSGGRDGYHHEPKFPFHLDHIPPEEDPNATRTLFVGNLDLETDPDEIRRIFSKYGIVEDVDVKRPAKGQGNAYAFVRFLNLDMSHEAKIRMSGKYIGRYQCKIGYGKAQGTNCLWIGGLGPWIRGETLEREFDRFGVIHRIEWPQGKNFAYVLYDNVDAASAACQEMRGFPLGGPDRRLRVDFSDPNHLQMAFDEMTIPVRGSQDYHPGGGDMYDGPAPYDREPPRRGDRGGFDDDWHRGGGGGRGRGGGGYLDVPRGPPPSRGRDDWGPRDRNNYNDDRGDDGYNNRRDNYGPRGNNDRRGGYRGRGGGGGGGGSGGYYGDRGYDRNQDNQYDRRSVGGGGDYRDGPPSDRNNGRPFSRDYTPPPKRRRSPSSDYQRRGDRERGAPVEPRETNGRRTSEPRDTFQPSVLQADNLTELTAELPCVWSGALVLKNSAFAAKMYLLIGDVSIVDHLMRDLTSTEMPLLKIMQRLRLDQPKLEEVGRRVESTPNHAILLAVPGSTQTVEESNTNIQQRPLRNLVSYLKQKEAAGVITLPPVTGNKKSVEAGVLHAFPPCQFSQGYLTKRAPKLGSEPTKEDHLIVVVVKNDA